MQTKQAAAVFEAISSDVCLSLFRLFVKCAGRFGGWCNRKTPFLLLCYQGAVLRKRNRKIFCVNISKFLEISY